MNKTNNKQSDWPPAKNDRTVAFYKELDRLLPLVPDAVKHLKKVTGKTFQNISPMNEKRWSKQCWESWTVLLSVFTMLLHGKTQAEADEEIWADIKPGNGFKLIGKCKYPKGGVGTVLYQDKLNKLYPDTRAKWNRVTGRASA